MALSAGLFNLALESLCLLVLRVRDSLGDMQLLRKIRIFTDDNDHPHDQDIGGEGKDHPERRDEVEESVRHRPRGRDILRK